MKFGLREYSTLKRENPENFKRFLEHIKKGGAFKSVGIRIGLFLNFLTISEKLPFISWVSNSSKGLFLGHMSEARVSKKLPFDESFLDAKNRKPEIFDWVIIGSGPGAAIAATSIPVQDSVLVVEAGSIPVTPPNEQHTLQHVISEFKSSGQEVIISTRPSQFAQAMVLGGGSEVNAGLYHKIPKQKRSEFISALGIDWKKYEIAEDFVHDLLDSKSLPADRNLSVIARGAEALNLETKNIPKWRTYYQNGDFTQHGMINTVWRRYIKNDNWHFLLNTKAVKIQKVADSNYLVLLRNVEDSHLKIECRNVVVAAGTIETPYLLAKSKLIKWSEIRFQWHPMLRAICRTNEEDLGWNDIDPYQAWTNDFRFKFGSAVSTPGLLAVNFGKQITKDESKTLRSYYISFVSSGKGGLIRGTNIPWYRFSNADKANMKEGAELLTKLIHSAGADFADSDIKVKPNPSTVHIFGSLPCNSQIFAKGTCELRNHPRIFVCDGSLLPFGPGVNPQAVIMSAVKALFDINDRRN